MSFLYFHTDVGHLLSMPIETLAWIVNKVIDAEQNYFKHRSSHQSFFLKLPLFTFQWTIDFINCYILQWNNQLDLAYARQIIIKVKQALKKYVLNSDNVYSILATFSYFFIWHCHKKGFPFTFLVETYLTFSCFGHK